MKINSRSAFFTDTQKHSERSLEQWHTSKKRTNTTQLVYKFGANPTGELPNEFWQTAKQMQFVWNNLVHMRNQLADNFDWLKISGKDKVKEHIVYWKEFDSIRRGYLKSDEMKDLLGGDECEFLIAKFEIADKTAKKNKTGLRKQYSLDRIQANIVTAKPRCRLFGSQNT